MEMIRIDRRTAAALILTARFVLGPLSIACPGFTSRLMLMPPEVNPGTPYFLRLFGGRDLYLGVAALLTPEPTRGQVIGTAAAVDAVDATAALIAGVRGDIPAPAALLAAGAGTMGSLLGLAAAGYGPLARRRPAADLSGSDPLVVDRANGDRATRSRS
ncbi:hypothetical protein ACU610_25330 [Geodermatophilus sp. URMC 61]|uniref:hypothetical protein n=1 Tax=Geodermatophilus sp. URMC 61 TaxID=3423411 RepID=UPI00406D0813